MSPADATQINQVLGSTHMPGQNVSGFPPQSKYGVPTKYQQFFRVSVNLAAMTGLADPARPMRSLAVRPGSPPSEDVGRAAI